jgi:hypothetical protein
LGDYGVWATLVSALIGFSGIALTLILQHRGDHELTVAIEEREKKRVAAAFRAELLSMVAYAKVAQAALKGWGETDFMFPTQSTFPLFGVLGSKLDVLEANQVSAVVGCYVWVSEIPARLALLAGSAAEKVPYVPVKGEHIHVAISLLSQLQNLALQAIEELGSDKPSAVGKTE